jgi:hypothetical protein
MNPLENLFEITRMNTTLNIPVSIHHDDSTGFTYCNDSRFESSLYAPSVNTAKNKLKPLLLQEIRDALTEHRNYQRKVIGCKSGEVLVVHFRHGNWGYDIAGEGRRGCSSCWGMKSFEEAVEKAIDHANQVWGGPIWQC